jgi:hypothetical protein
MAAAAFLKDFAMYFWFYLELDQRSCAALSFEAKFSADPV